MSITPNEGHERGKKRAERGINAAAYSHKWDISRDQLKMLELFLADPSRTATSDDTVENLAKKHKDGGKWRGQVTKGLARKNAIRRVGFADSCRTSRNTGTVRVWEVAKLDVVKQLTDELREYFRSNPNRPADKNETGTAV